MIDTTGLLKSDVLCALYNRSQPQGMGFLAYDATPMSREDAAELLQGECYFDYLRGRVMKVNLSQDDGFDESLYDRDNGNGAAQLAINELRENSAESPAIMHDHSEAVQKQSAIAMNRLNQETRTSSDDEMSSAIRKVQKPIDKPPTRIDTP